MRFEHGNCGWISKKKKTATVTANNSSNDKNHCARILFMQGKKKPEIVSLLAHSLARKMYAYKYRQTMKKETKIKTTIQ